VVNSSPDEMLCMVYVFEGKIIGVFSARDGWVKPTYEQAMVYISTAQAQAKVMASYLPVRDREHAATLGFSLTGLADTNKQQTAMLAQQLQAIDSFTTIRSEASTYTTVETVTRNTGAFPAVRTRRNPVMQSKTSPNVPPSAMRTTSTFAIAP
jgi:hypothetical protein